MRLLLFAICLTFSTASVAEETEEREIDLLIREGIALHDQGLYDEAIAMYEKALAIDQDNAFAGYEMAYAYQASSDYAGCIAAANSTLGRAKANEAHDEYISNLYSVLASCHSASGESSLALDVFREGLESFPENYWLHFNIAVTLANTGELGEAEQHFATAMKLEPLHPSPYFMLAQVLLQQNDVTSMLALIAFLQLEFNTQRTSTAAADLFSTMYSPAVADEPAVMTINDTDDLSTASFQLQIAYMTAIIERTAEGALVEPLGENVTKALSTYIRIVGTVEAEEITLDYVADYLLPMCIRLVEADAVEAFAWYVADTAGVPGAGEWLQANPEEVDKLVGVFET